MAAEQPDQTETPQQVEAILKRSEPTTLTIKLGGRAVNLTRENTTIYAFYEPWKHMRHLFRRAENSTGNGMFIWSPDETLLLRAAQHRFPMILTAEPADVDITNYMLWQEKVLTGELAQMEGEE